jgi:phosphoenolpyruvate carboxykinase (ATP)
VVKAIAEGSIEWETDPDFGYEVAARLPGISDEELLRPRRLYERTGRADEYAQMVQRFKAERKEFLAKFPKLDSEIVEAI